MTAMTKSVIEKKTVEIELDLASPLAKMLLGGLSAAHIERLKRHPRRLQRHFARRFKELRRSEKLSGESIAEMEGKIASLNRVIHGAGKCD